MSRTIGVPRELSTAGGFRSAGQCYTLGALAALPDDMPFPPGIDVRKTPEGRLERLSKLMVNSLLDHLAQGQFSFLAPDPAEIRRLFPHADQLLPKPHRIYLEDETAAPLIGFPVLLSRGLHMLEQAAAEYLAAEEEAQIAFFTRQSFDSKGFAARWERYRALLAKATENSAGMSFGNRYLDVFWLRHSQIISRVLREVPKRLLRRDLTLGREHGDSLKYRVFTKWADRIVHLTHDVVGRVAAELGEDPEILFPTVLQHMRDNVLIFTEDLISPDLSELSSYFNGELRIDGRDLRQRLQAVAVWLERHLASDQTLRSAVHHLLGVDPNGCDPTRLLHHPGFLSFVSSHITYSDSHFPTNQQIAVWEPLLLQLKEFELLQTMRKMLVPVEIEEGTYISRDRSVNMTWIGGPPVLRLSSVNRPLDFLSSWIVDPLVRRFGLVYDISDFSAIISMLGLAQKTSIESAFRQTYTLQTKINQLAASHDLKMEKYLGDGAFYSGRKARQLLPVAIRLQRLYAEAVDRGYPFDRGLRVAINFGEYRLLPLAGEDRESARYEYFGHGLVELSRLSTGKKTQEIDELKHYLIGQGYPEAVVTKFFAPMQRQNAGDLVDKDEQARRFYAYINPNGTLINEGIVATDDYIQRLGTFAELWYGRQGGRGYVIVAIPDGDGSPVLVGLRKLGLGKFKGLEKLPVYEIIDGACWTPDRLKPIPTKNLKSALERVFASSFSSSSSSRSLDDTAA